MPYTPNARSKLGASLGVTSRLERLIARVKQGDQSAAEELLRIAHAEQTGTKSVKGQTTETQRAREAANQYLGMSLPPLERSGGALNAFVANDLGDLLIGGAGAAIAGPVLAGLGTGAATAGNIAGAGGVSDILGTVKKYAPLVLGGLGAVGAGQMGSQAEDLRNQAAGYATNDYKQRAPLRAAFNERALAPMPVRENLDPLFADPANPYKRPLARMG